MSKFLSVLGSYKIQEFIKQEFIAYKSSTNNKSHESLVGAFMTLLIDLMMNGECNLQKFSCLTMKSTSIQVFPVREYSRWPLHLFLRRPFRPIFQELPFAF